LRWLRQLCQAATPSEKSVRPRALEEQEEEEEEASVITALRFTGLHWREE
jgi:hypothetical protein